MLLFHSNYKKYSNYFSCKKINDETLNKAINVYKLSELCFHIFIFLILIIYL